MEESVKKTNSNGYEVYNIISILRAFEQGRITDEIISGVIAPFSNDKEKLNIFSQSMAGLSGMFIAKANAASASIDSTDDTTEIEDENEEDKDELLTINKVAEHLDVKRQSIYNYLKSGKLDYVELPSGRKRIPFRELHNFKNGS